MIRFYILDEFGEPQQVTDVQRWAAWFDTADRQLAFDRIGDISISTEFLGVDFRVAGNVPPLIFETTISQDDLPMHAIRRATRVAAIEAHSRAVIAARGVAA